ncbi:MAG: SDR family NAD(P)-dependent oxidoreductase [Dinoroseobacter sp.]|nr:SDR family NAD(P)-dependent oxidoreductase [Dinoroseobacter sp.]
MRIAVITGASKGIGLETARQLSDLGHHVILTGRNKAALVEAAGSIDDAEWHALDVSDQVSVAKFFDWLKAKHGRLDVLVNNAGRLYGGHGSTVLQTDPAVLTEAIENNAVGAFRTLQRTLPMMARGGFGRIVNVSSGMGALTDMGAGAVPYRASKATLNALTLLAAHEATANVKVNAVCPGWVRTDMGGQSASRDVETGARGIVWAATLPEDGPTGGFFRDCKAIAW